MAWLLGALLLLALPLAAEPIPSAWLEIPADQGYLGFRSQSEPGRGATSAIQVLEVYPEGPAAKAGLEAGDRILAIDEETFSFDHDLEMVLWYRRFQAGQTLTLDIDRGGSTLELTLEAVAMPEAYRDRLARWLEIAAQRVTRGVPIYCEEERCEDPSVGEEDAGKSPRFEEWLARLETPTRLRILRTADGFLLDQHGTRLGIGLTFEDLPPTIRQHAETVLGMSESLELDVSRDPVSRQTTLRVLEGE